MKERPVEEALRGVGCGEGSMKERPAKDLFPVHVGSGWGAPASWVKAAHEEQCATRHAVEPPMGFGGASACSKGAHAACLAGATSLSPSGGSCGFDPLSPRAQLAVDDGICALECAHKQIDVVVLEGAPMTRPV